MEWGGVWGKEGTGNPKTRNEINEDNTDSVIKVTTKQLDNVG